MKKLIIALALAVLPLAGYAKDKESSVPMERLMSLVSEYSGHDGFEVVKLGSFGTSMLKTAMKIAAAKDGDDDIKTAMKLMKGVKKMAIVDYEDCTPAVKNAFNTRLQRLLGSAELLMEFKDDDESMKVYGIVEGDGSEVRNFVMHAQQDGALICLFGTIQIDTIMEIAGKD